METVEDQRTKTLGPKRRRAVWGAFAGFFVDMFDVYLPIVVLQYNEPTGHYKVHRLPRTVCSPRRIARRHSAWYDVPEGGVIR